MKKITVVLPAYNEERMLKSVLSSLPKKIKGNPVTTVVVDDGSSDNTCVEAKKYADHVLKHKINLGAGSATITGIKFSKKFLNPDVLVTMDSDGQHDPKDLIKLVKPIIEKKYDAVIGSRMINRRGMPLLKVIINKIANIVTLLFSGTWVSDSQTGFRAYSRKALELIEIKTTGYEYCTEILGELHRNNLLFTEVPIKVIYNSYSRSKGQSILNSVNILIKLINRSLTK